MIEPDTFDEETGRGPVQTAGVAAEEILPAGRRGKEFRIIERNGKEPFG